MSEKDIKENFDAFVKKYNNAVELHNSKCKTILRGYKLIHLGDKVRPLIEGSYSINEDGSIDIDGNFTMREIYDFDVDVQSETLRRKENPIFIIDDFPFTFNRISGDFRIALTHIKNLDMFPRFVGKEATISCNQYVSSIKGVTGSVVKGECFIHCESETLYFPDFVGGDLRIDNRCSYKDFGSDKIVQVGGCFTFLSVHCKDPRVAKFKEIVKAKEYQFNERKGFRASEQSTE